MENKQKTAVIVLLLFFVGASPVSANFGLVPMKTDYTINSSSKTLTLGLMNLGERPLRMDFASRGVSNGEIDFDQEELILPPSEIKQNPSGSNWYYLGDRYVELTYVDFTYYSSELTGSEEFYVEVNSQRLESSELDSGPEIAQVREIEYSINFPGEKKQENALGNWRPEDYKIDGSNSGSGAQDAEKSSQSNTGNTSGNETASRSTEDSQDAEELWSGEENGDGSRSLTVILLAIILITAVYIYNEL